MSSTNTKTNAASLLGLPAELRLKLYASISPPLKDHIGHYRSLILSCKTLKAEAEVELVQNIQRFLKDIMSTWDKTHEAPLRIEMPTQVGQVKHVEIEIPTSTLRAPEMFGKFPVAFVPLLGLHVASLTLSFYDDEDWRSCWENMTPVAMMERH